jgi:hypothetical protein
MRRSEMHSRLPERCPEAAERSSNGSYGRCRGLRASVSAERRRGMHQVRRRVPGRRGRHTLQGRRRARGASARLRGLRGLSVTLPDVSEGRRDKALASMRRWGANPLSYVGRWTTVRDSAPASAHTHAPLRSRLGLVVRNRAPGVADKACFDDFIRRPSRGKGDHALFLQSARALDPHSLPSRRAKRQPS